MQKEKPFRHKKNPVHRCLPPGICWNMKITGPTTHLHFCTHTREWQVLDKCLELRYMGQLYLPRLKWPQEVNAKSFIFTNFIRWCDIFIWWSQLIPMTPFLHSSNYRKEESLTFCHRLRVVWECIPNPFFPSCILYGSSTSGDMQVRDCRLLLCLKGLYPQHKHIPL